MWETEIQTPTIILIDEDQKFVCKRKWFWEYTPSTLRDELFKPKSEETNSCEMNS